MKTLGQFLQERLVAAQEWIVYQEVEGSPVVYKTSKDAFKADEYSEYLKAKGIDAQVITTEQFAKKYPEELD